MPSFDYSRFYQDTIGDTGVQPRQINAYLPLAIQARDDLKKLYEEKSLPLLHLPKATDDVAELKKLVESIDVDYTDVVILGTGGSSLGAQTLAQLSDWRVTGCHDFREAARLHFFDNLDPFSLEKALSNLSLDKTIVVSVSKSGGTGETLMQTSLLLAAFEKASLGDAIKKQFIGISEPRVDGKANGLRDLLEPFECAFFDHDPLVGGRYSVLSNVGCLPALFAGLDPNELRKGAGEVLDSLFACKDEDLLSHPAIMGAVASQAFQAARGMNISVMMGYGDRFDRLIHWYVQLWGESIGKNGVGTTPLPYLGPVDQHSQLQLYLGGPRDKLVTLLSQSTKGLGPIVDPKFAKQAGLPDFADRSVGCLVDAQARATADTLARNGIPVRHIHVEKLDMESSGSLLMTFMLETILAGFMMGIDPFDQPAVEEGKILAKEYMAL